MSEIFNPANLNTRKKQYRNAVKGFSKYLSKTVKMGKKETKLSAGRAVAKKALEEGRPLYPDQVKNKRHLKKYVQVGMREEHTDMATQRSAGGAVIQRILNHFSGVDNENLNKNLNKTKRQIRTMGKIGFGAASYVAARVMSPTKIGDSTLYKGFKQKEFKRQK